MRFCQAITPITQHPDTVSEQVSEGLFGEAVLIAEQLDGYCLIRTQRDDYTGYVPKSALSDNLDVASTHNVVHRFTPLFSRPDVKSSVVDMLPFGAELCLQDVDEIFYRTEQAHYIFKQHCQRINTVVNSDCADLAQSVFLGTPYRWGGRSPSGIDCSGLVQQCASAAGLMLPRDSGPQEHFLTHAVADADRQRNDLVYWPGHVGILLDAQNLLHATAHSLSTVIEPLADVIRRAGPISSVLRLPDRSKLF